MENVIESFVSYLHNVKKMSLNTELSYKRDLVKVADYLNTQGIADIKKVTATNLNSYIFPKTLRPPR